MTTVVRIAEIKAEIAERDAAIKRMWPTHTTREIASVLGVTCSSVRKRAIDNLCLRPRPLDARPS